MKRLRFLTIALVLVIVLLMSTLPVFANGPSTINYGDVTLSGGFQSGNFAHVWDLTQCDLEISFTYNANGLVDDAGTHAWAELGIRQVGYGNFNPTWMTGGAGVWLATDYDWTTNTFDPDPVGSPTQDLDDKLILQRGGGMGEGSYDLPSVPPNPWANHAVWFDRDGVDPWQALMWGAIDGATYNTGGYYDVIITLHASDATSGTAYMNINGRDQGFYVPNWHAGPTDLSPAGMNFTGDMTQMQVFYGLYGYGATHTVAFEDIEVTGCLATIDINIDIKPGSCPNSINLQSRGVLPVAILTDSDFDASTIDPDTVEFAGAAPLRWSMEDVDGDADMDIVFHFKRLELNLDATSTSATLTALTNIGQPVAGEDTVNIVPKK